MKNYFSINSMITPITTLFFSIIAASPSAFAMADPGIGSYTIAVPDEVESHIVKEEADNAVYYKFKKADGSTAFLFSIQRVSYEQWSVVREQLHNIKLLGQHDNRIYFAQRTERTSMRGPDKEQYDMVMNQLDEIIKSIRF